MTEYRDIWEDYWFTVRLDPFQHLVSFTCGVAFGLVPFLIWMML